MFYVYCDSYLLNDSEAEIFNAKMELEVCKNGSFSFTIYPDHPYYDEVVAMKSIITVKCDCGVQFRGRILNIEKGMHNQKICACEGDLAFLLDSMIAPHTFSGLIYTYFTRIINEHNSKVDSFKRFNVGDFNIDNVSITVDAQDYKSAHEILHSNILNVAGACVVVRHEDDGNYLDIMPSTMDTGNVSEQKIEYGKNLIDIKRASNLQDAFSCAIPLGAKVGDSRIDIKSVNGGLDYISKQEAIDLMGKIYKTVVFDVITDASTLKTAGTAYLNNNFLPDETVEITSADLSGIEDVGTFHIGQYVDVCSSNHFANNPQRMMIKKMSVNLFDPSQNKIIIGHVNGGITDIVA